MSFSFHPAALAELKEAALHYTSVQPGLGDRFAHAVEAAIRRIVAHPRRGAIVKGEARRMRVAVFPYAVVYRLRGDHARILAVMHGRRKPDYWQQRN